MKVVTSHSSKAEIYPTALIFLFAMSIIHVLRHDYFLLLAREYGVAVEIRVCFRARLMI